MTWDPLDRLAEMTGTLGARYQYDGADVVGVYVGGSGSVGNRLIRGPGPDELVVSYAGTTAASPLWTLQDHQSSSIAITDPAGAALYTLAYDEYGVPRPGNAGRFMYTGQMWMPDYAAYHYKARAYRPDLGRFLQTDPVGYAQGLNLYAYVGNDPVNATDPTGESRLLRVGFNVLRRTIQNRGNIVRAARDEGVSIVGDVATLVGPDSSPADRVVAAVDLASPISVSEARAGVRAIRRLAPDRITAPPPRRGRAPTGDDGHPVELHHDQRTGDVEEMTRSDHRLGENYTRNHENTGQTESQVDRAQARRERERYWKEEQDRGRFDDD